MRPVLALLAVALLAGCASPPPADEPVMGNESVVFVEDYALGNTTLPAEELQNATLGAEHEHDAWHGAEQLVLLDADATAGLCEGEMDAAAYAAVMLLGNQEAAYGCVRASLPEGVLVPEGTGTLRVEVDATEALKSGSLAFQWRNKAREEEGETTTEKVHAWEVALTSADWDVPHASATTFVMYVASRGPVGAFDGPVHLKVTAIRMEGWEPVLAIAHVDHWKLPQLHDFPAPGVMRLFDGETSVTNIDPARFTGGGEAHEGLVLSDIIAPGASFVTVVADTTESDCAPVLDCFLVPILHVGGYDRDRVGALLLQEGGRRVYVWSVPDEVPVDSVYQEESTTAIEPRIDGCAAGQPDTCGFASLASTTVHGRLQAFAWEGEVDLELLKTLADGGTA